MLGNILYLHVHDLRNSLVVNQDLNPYRFVKVIEETVVDGGTSTAQYMQYKACSLINNSKVYTINNYLSPLNYITIDELINIIEELKPILQPERISHLNSILSNINNIIKEGA